MTQKKTYTHKELIIESEESRSSIEILWKGRSAARQPADFITPILSDLIEKGKAAGKKIVMDFRLLEFMNSSTITPISKILESLKGGDQYLKIIYNRGKTWQELSFSALKIFETEDGRISINGK